MPPKKGKKKTAQGKPKPISTPILKLPPPKSLDWGQYKRLDNGMKILHGTVAQSNKVFGVSSRNKQSAACCIIAAVYAQINKPALWTSQDINKILREGDGLFRASVSKVPLLKWGVLKPHCVHPTFYLESKKVTTFVTSDKANGTHKEDDPVLQGVLLEHVPELLSDEFIAVILNFKELNFTIYKLGDMFLFFCPHDADQRGNLVREYTGRAYVMLVPSLEILSTFLGTWTYGHFWLYALKIVSLLDVDVAISNMIRELQLDEIIIPKVLQPETSDVSMPKKPVKPADIKSVGVSEKEAPVEEESEEDLEQKPSNLRKADTEANAKALEIALSGNYKQFAPDRGSLLCNKFQEDPDYILYTNLAALIVLYHKPSYSWTCKTINEIISLGEDLADELEPEEEERPFFFAKSCVITYKDKEYKLDFEKKIFGQVSSKKRETPDILMGLQNFFHYVDTGIIVGPQTVAVWKEKGVYFMFDPKERDGLGRKWTKRLSKQLGATKDNGGACVVWHKMLQTMAETYAMNVPYKYQKEPLRIIKVSVAPFVLDEDDDWGNWKCVDTEKWILRGTESVCDHLDKDDENRVDKIVCVYCYACAYLYGHTEEDWEQNTLNIILKEGLGMFKEEKEEEEEEEEEEESDKDDEKDNKRLVPPLKNINLNVEIDGKAMIIQIGDCVVTGKCISELLGPGDLDLRHGLQAYFTSFKFGVLHCVQTSVAIWTDGEDYYAMDIAEKYNLGEYVDSNPANSGFVTAVKFTSLQDLITLIIKNFKFLGCEQYCISKIEAFIVEKGLNLKHYVPFIETGAILMQKGYHEGHVSFGHRANKQTLCNLVMSICYARLYNGADWSKEDLVDLLILGDAWYQNMIKDIGECESKVSQMKWPHDHELDPRVGMCSFDLFRQEYPPIPLREPSMVYLEEEEGGLEQEEGGPSINEGSEEAEEAASNAESSIASHTFVTLLNMLKRGAFASGILDTKFFSVAIWKQGRTFFIFDPKASADDSTLTPFRLQKAIQNIIKEKEMKKKKNFEEEGGESILTMYEEESIAPTTIVPAPPVLVDLNTLSKEGSAYVAWFPSVAELRQHIISRIPIEYQHENVVFHLLKVKILKQKYHVSMFNHFEERLLASCWVMRASMSQNDRMFPNKGLQCVSTSVIALAFTLISEVEQWSMVNLDMILKYGDRLYTKSLERHRLKPKTKIDIHQVAPVFSIYRIKFTSTILPEVLKGQINDPSNIKEPNSEFVDAINSLGDANCVGGVLKLNEGYHVAVWKGDQLYMFDSHELDVDGELGTPGAACAMRFTETDVMFGVLRRKFHEPNKAIDYELYKVNIEMGKPFQQRNATTLGWKIKVPLDQSAFVIDEQLFKDGRILNIAVEDANISEVYKCISAIVYSYLVHSEFWTMIIINEIIALAKRLIDSARPSEDEPRLPQVQQDLKDILRNFVVDGMRCNLNIDEVIRGPIEQVTPADISLISSLSIFLKNYRRILLITKTFICAIWREHETYYLFNSAEGKDTFLVAITQINRIIEWIIANRGKDEDSNWYELINVEVTTQLEKEMPKLDGNFTVLKTDCIGLLMPQPEKEECICCYKEVSPEMAVLEENSKLCKHYNMEYVSRSQKAACIVAAGMAFVKCVNEWGCDELEIITRSSIILYLQFAAIRASKTLDIYEMERDFRLKNKRLHVEPLPPSRELPTKDNLCVVLCYIFKKHQTAYITTKEINLIVVFWNRNYYCFRPSSFCSEDGYTPACIMKFGSFLPLVDYIVDQFDEYDKFVEIGPIKVIRL